MKNLIIIISLAMLSSCTIYEGTYSSQSHNCELMERGQYCLSDHSCCESRDHSTEIYYHNDLPYWGFYNNFYYYYGVPHLYPWWYWYTILPPYTYSSHTHVSIQLNNSRIVRNPRGSKFNNGKGRTYTPRPSINKAKSTNRNNVKINTNRNNVKINTNRNNVKVNTNRNNVKVNTNRNNIKVKTNRNNIKVNTNKRSNRPVRRSPR